MSFDNEQRHKITKILHEHILDLYETGIDLELENIHSQYRSLVKQLYIPYDKKNEYDSLCLALNKSYMKLKNYIQEFNHGQ